MPKSTLVLVCTVILVLFNQCQSDGSSIEENSFLSYSDEEYEKDFEMLESLKRKMLAADSVILNTSNNATFVNVEAINKLESKSIRFIYADQGSLDVVHNSGVLPRDDFELDQTPMVILLQTDSVDPAQQELMNNLFLRHFACDYSKMALFRKDIKFDYDYFNNHRSIIEQLSNQENLCLLVFDNWEIEHPILDTDGLNNSFYSGTIKATATAIDLTSREILFRTEILVSNSEEIEYLSYSQFTSSYEAKLELDKDLFGNLMLSTEERITSVLNSEGVDKEVSFAFKENH